MKNKYDGFDGTFTSYNINNTDRLVNIVNEELLSADRVRTRDCLLHLKKNEISHTQRYGMLIFLRKLISDDSDLRKLSLGDFIDTLEEYEELVNENMNKKVMMKGIEDRMEGNDERG